MANPFVHVELQSNDLARAMEFYRNLFGWKLEDAPGMEYTMIHGGGIMRNPLPEVHSF
jgi:hypothetical protein